MKDSLFMDKGGNGLTLCHKSAPVPINMRNAIMAKITLKCELDD